MCRVRDCMPAISGTIDPPSMPGLDEGWAGG